MAMTRPKTAGQGASSAPFPIKFLAPPRTDPDLRQWKPTALQSRLQGRLPTPSPFSGNHPSLQHSQAGRLEAGLGAAVGSKTPTPFTCQGSQEPAPGKALRDTLGGQGSFFLQSIIDKPPKLFHVPGRVLSSALQGSPSAWGRQDYPGVVPTTNEILRAQPRNPNGGQLTGGRAHSWGTLTNDLK